MAATMTSAGSPTGAGFVYLVHFTEPIGDLSNPYGAASHYLGWSREPERRLAAHAAARGARIMREVERRGIPWLVVGTWPGPRTLERAAKRQKSSWRWCVVCREERGMDASVVPDLGRLLERELERAVELELAAERELELVAEELAEVELERELEDEHWPAA
jgi:predicted GIY-YIG superfamily endonuclease